MALKYPNRGIRHSLNAIVPNWLANKPPFNTGFKILYAIALVFDVLVEMMLQGVYAAMPGKGTPTALGFIGQGRGILQGLAETKVSYAKRLRNWLTYWYNAGSGEVLAGMIQSFLPNNPRVTIWDRSGNWVIVDTTGSTLFGKDTAWNWDGISNPERMGWWSDIWIVVYPDPWDTWEVGGGGGATGWANPAANAQWQSKPPTWLNLTVYPKNAVVTFVGINYQSLSAGNVSHSPPSSPTFWAVIAPSAGAQGLGFGHQVPRVAVDGIYQIVSTWKGAHTFLVAMMFTNVPALFLPGFLAGQGNPDGTWGRWGRYNAGTGHWEASRTRELTIGGVYAGHVRYWTPGSGG